MSATEHTDSPKEEFGEHTVLLDFRHHAPGVARLNHGSFGCAPLYVMEAQRRFQDLWLAQPDALYFAAGDEALSSKLLKAKEAVLPLLGVFGEERLTDRVALVDNSATATAIISKRWGAVAEKWVQTNKQSTTKPVIFYLDVAYGASVYCYEDYLGGCCDLVPLDMLVGGERFGFPQTLEELYANFERSLLVAGEKYTSSNAPVFGMFDAISSQPAFKLPIAKMVRLFRTTFPGRTYEGQGAQETQNPRIVEICVDGAHCLGGWSDFDVRSSLDDPDFFFGNLYAVTK